MWWIYIIILTASGLGLFYFLAVKGGEVALKRDREEHLKIVNAARRRARQPALEEHELPEHPAPKPWGDEGFGPLDGLFAHPNAPEPEADLTAELAPFVSIVLLGGEAPRLHEADVRSAAERAWGVELPSDNPADEEFVAFKDPPTGMIAAGGFRFLVHDNDEPYFTNVADTMASIHDPALRSSVHDATSWRGVDMLGQSSGLTKDNAYSMIGKLALNLADEGTLAVYVPEFRQIFPFDAGTRKALAGETVIGSLRESHMV